MEMSTVGFTMEKNMVEKVEINLGQQGINWIDFVKRAIWQYYPDKETLEALEEVDEMILTGQYGKKYTDVHEMMKELLR